MVDFLTGNFHLHLFIQTGVIITKNVLANNSKLNSLSVKFLPKLLKVIFLTCEKDEFLDIYPCTMHPYVYIPESIRRGTTGRRQTSNNIVQTGMSLEADRQPDLPAGLAATFGIVFQKLEEVGMF